MSSEQCAPRLSLPPAPFSRALPLPRLPSHLRPAFPVFLSLDVSSLCQFAISAPSLSPQPFSLPLDLSFPISTSSVPFSSSALVSPFLSLSSLFPLSFPSPVLSRSSPLPTLLFPTLFLSSSSRLPLWSPASLRLPFSLGRGRIIRCVSAPGEDGGSRSYLRGTPLQDRGRRWPGRGPPSSPHPEAPLSHPLPE